MIQVNTLILRLRRRSVKGIMFRDLWMERRESPLIPFIVINFKYSSLYGPVRKRLSATFRRRIKSRLDSFRRPFRFISVWNRDSDWSATLVATGERRKSLRMRHYGLGFWLPPIQRLSAVPCWNCRQTMMPSNIPPKGRAKKACDQCRRLKVKCEGSLPCRQCRVYERSRCTSISLSTLRIEPLLRTPLQQDVDMTPHLVGGSHLLSTSNSWKKSIRLSQHSSPPMYVIRFMISAQSGSWTMFSLLTRES